MTAAACAITFALLGLPTVLDVRLPMAEQAIEEQPAPQPATEPRAIDRISMAEWYVIESDVPLLVVESPQGIVQITAESGPIRARGQFAGGSGVESRTYDWPHVYFVEPIKAGTVELLIWEQSADAGPADVIRQALTVSGSGPQPPPDPDPEPDPDGITVDDINGFRVVILADESADLATLNAINGLPLRQWLEANTDDWRRWDRSTITERGLENEAELYQRLWSEIRDRVPDGPQVLAIKGTHCTIFPADSQILQRLEALR